MVTQIDIETAFLQAPLAEDIYMEIPNGYKDKFKKTAVLKLNKAIYGLRQSSKAFNDKLTWSLKQLGWSQLKSDPCIFKRGKKYWRHLLMIVWLGQLANNLTLSFLPKFQCTCVLVIMAILIT